MTNNKIKILLFADTHLGFDLPINPKVKKRRRGNDFFNNFEYILNEAVKEKADLIIHGGDVFFRSKVHHSIVTKSFQMMIKVAEKGIPIFIVPGNHERSFLPVSLFDTHPNIKIFDRPRTYLFEKNGVKIALGGFPSVRKGIRAQFKKLYDSTRLGDAEADCKFLCLHQTVEGAAVGVQNYVFRNGEDIISSDELPLEIESILSGHIHRAQILVRDLRGNELSCPVVYPGSIERTSFAERNEKKGYYQIELAKKVEGNIGIDYIFKELYARPMMELKLELEKSSPENISQFLIDSVRSFDPDVILRIKIVGEYNKHKHNFLKAENLRRICPDTMNVELTFPSDKNLFR